MGARRVIARRHATDLGDCEAKPPSFTADVHINDTTLPTTRDGEKHDTMITKSSLARCRRNGSIIVPNNNT